MGFRIMFIRLLFAGLLTFPHITYSISCANPGLSFYLLDEDNIIVSFKVVDNHLTYLIPDNWMEIEITKEFVSNKISDVNIRLTSGWYYSPVYGELSPGSEWVSVLTPSDDSYVLPICAPKLRVENGMVIGNTSFENTGIENLDSRDEPLSLEVLEFGLSIYQQGLKAADMVCTSSSSYCSIKPTYDPEIGILDLPSIAYPYYGFSAYANAKLKKIDDNPMTFQVMEIK